MPLHSARKCLLAVITTGVLVSGCATTGDTPDQQRTVTEGAAVGAILGGLLGAAVSDNKGVGALIGAVGGGAIGAAIGRSVADRKAQYANEEDFLIAEIDLNNDFIAEAEAENRQIEKDIVGLERESTRLAAAYRAGKVSRNALANQKTTLQNQLAKAKKLNSLTEKQLADANEVHRDVQKKRGTQDKYTRQLASNIQKLKATQQQSSRNVTSLQRVYDSMAI